MLTKEQQLDLLTRLKDFFDRLDDEASDDYSVDSYGRKSQVCYIWDRDLINKVADELGCEIEDLLWDLREEMENENN